VPHISFVVENLGPRAGTDVAQVYLTHAPRRTQQRLLGWSRVDLASGESRRVTVAIDPRMLADWDSGAHGWRIDAGLYDIALGASAVELTPAGSLKMAAAKLKP
jgi:beta-glucosidase